MDVSRDSEDLLVEEVEEDRQKAGSIVAARAPLVLRPPGELVVLLEARAAEHRVRRRELPQVVVKVVEALHLWWRGQRGWRLAAAERRLRLRDSAWARGAVCDSAQARAGSMVRPAPPSHQRQWVGFVRGAADGLVHLVHHLHHHLANNAGVRYMGGSRTVQLPAGPRVPATSAYTNLSEAPLEALHEVALLLGRRVVGLPVPLGRKGRGRSKRHREGIEGQELFVAQGLSRRWLDKVA